MATEREPTPVEDGKWYAVAGGKPPRTESCCDCALTHIVEHKVENGILWVRWIVDEETTRAERKRRKITNEVRAVKRKEKNA